MKRRRTSLRRRKKKRRPMPRTIRNPTPASPPCSSPFFASTPEIRDGSVATLFDRRHRRPVEVKLVFRTLRKPERDGHRPFQRARRGRQRRAFTARIAIPRQAETGDWFVGNLQITDKANNPLNLVYAKATVLRVARCASPRTIRTPSRRTCIVSPSTKERSEPARRSDRCRGRRRSLGESHRSRARFRAPRSCLRPFRLSRERRVRLGGRHLDPGERRLRGMDAEPAARRGQGQQHGPISRAGLHEPATSVSSSPAAARLRPRAARHRHAVFLRRGSNAAASEMTLELFDP